VARRRVAAFDFDGTLARGDSLIPFLTRVCGRRAVARALAWHGPAIALALAGRGSRDLAKERFVSGLLRGRSAAEVATAGSAFASHLVARRLRPDMAARVAWHRGEGHQLVLVSASLTVYLAPVAEALGFDAVLATRLEVDDAGLLTGRLLGANVRGPEKAARLAAWLGDDAHDVELWAYGDSSGDHDLLALASSAFMVGRRGLSSWPR
jgi:phosphatidylglycerophosphatase C